jgi:hypothetical protein
MGFDQKGTSAFRVGPGADGQWEVREDGFDKPLALFQSLGDAQEYARDLAKTKKGSTVKLLDKDGKDGKEQDTAALLRA